MLRRIDQFIGRHMSAKRWVRAWAIIAMLCSVLAGAHSQWWLIGLFLAAFMFDANLRRLR